MKGIFGDWDGSIADARRLQETLAAEVVLRDEAPETPRWLAGFDVGFEDGPVKKRKK